MRLAVREALVAASELGQLPLDLLFPREDSLLDLEDLVASLGDLGLDLGAQLHCLLTHFDLCLAPQGIGFALAVLDQLAPEAARLADTRGAETHDRDRREERPCRNPDGDSDPEHVAPPGCRCRGSHRGDHPAFERTGRAENSFGPTVAARETTRLRPRQRRT